MSMEKKNDMQTSVWLYAREKGYFWKIKIRKKCKLKITFYDNIAASGICIAKIDGEFDVGRLYFNYPFINGLTAEITHEGKEDINNLFRVFCI